MCDKCGCDTRNPKEKSSGKDANGTEHDHSHVHADGTVHNHPHDHSHGDAHNHVHSPVVSTGNLKLGLAGKRLSTSR